MTCSSNDSTPLARAVAGGALLLVLAAALVAALTLPGEARALHFEGHPPEERVRDDYGFERRDALVKNVYKWKDLPNIGPNGEIGVNRDPGSPFWLSPQQYGDVYVRAGMTRRRPNRIEDGLRAFEYAFAQQNPDGSFDEDQSEAYAFFVGSVAHSILLLRERRVYVERYGAQLDAFERGLRRAIPHMVEDGMWEDFVYRNRFYTHTGYSMGNALGLAGKLLENAQYRRLARKAVRMALGRQKRNGVNPELGGYDVRYQMVGTVYAERYVVYYPTGPLARKLEQMIDDSLHWMRKRVDRDGWIDYRGSTRTCEEENSNDNDKTPGYAFAMRAFFYWGAREKVERHFKVGARIARYLDTRVNDGTLCGPKDPIAVEPQGRGGSGDDGVGTPRALRAEDLYE